MRPAKSIKGYKTLYDGLWALITRTRDDSIVDVDLIIVRENTEGEYCGVEHEVRTWAGQLLI